jgi:hypothetical protein
MPFEPLCPDPAWRICKIPPEHDCIILSLEPMRTAVACPVCGTFSRRGHSRYRRQLWDLPRGRWPVLLVVGPQQSLEQKRTLSPDFRGYKAG